MIERLVVENFKSLRRVDLRLGRFNLLIGANASGKSNFLDALRVLQGIGHGFTVNEILDGKPRSATTEIWDGIRGGSDKARFTGAGRAWRRRRRAARRDGSDKAYFAGANDLGEVTLKAHGRLGHGMSRIWEFEIGFSPSAGQLTRERFNLGPEQVYSFGADLSHQSSRSPIDLLRETYTSAQSKLVEVASDRYNFKSYIVASAAGVLALLANTQHLAPSAPVLREYSRSHQVQRLGDHGENFAALIQTICRDAKTKDAYLSWLRQLRPEEVDDVGTLKGAVGEPLFMLRENEVDFPAPVLSDGTLRFAAIAAAFFQPEMPALMTIEEIENGVHASRVKTLLELLRSQAETAGTQVMATTHSPTVLDWLEAEDYKTTFLFRRDEETGESKVRSLADVPRFMDVVGKKPVSELFSEGWLEVAS